MDASTRGQLLVTNGMGRICQAPVHRRRSGAGLSVALHTFLAFVAWVSLSKRRIDFRAFVRLLRNSATGPSRLAHGHRSNSFCTNTICRRLDAGSFGSSARVGRLRTCGHFVGSADRDSVSNWSDSGRGQGPNAATGDTLVHHPRHRWLACIVRCPTWPFGESSEDARRDQRCRRGSS